MFFRAREWAVAFWRWEPSTTVLTLRMASHSKNMTEDLPLISVVMLVHNREHLLPLALKSYLNQAYSNMELVVVDDSDPEVDLSEYFERIGNCTHIRLRDRMPLGEKRNVGCEACSGELIAVMDSDDWSSTDRISVQHQYMACNPMASICGFNQLHFYDLCGSPEPVAYRYQQPTPDLSFCVCGASLMFRRSFWRSCPYPSEISIAEDLDYCTGHRDATVAVSGLGLPVALLHEENISSRKQVESGAACFAQVRTTELPGEFFETLRGAEIGL